MFEITQTPALRALPFAKSDKARLTSLLLVPLPAVAGFVFGWQAAVVVLPVVVPVLWRQEHHFFLGRARSEDVPQK